MTAIDEAIPGQPGGGEAAVTGAATAGGNEPELRFGDLPYGPRMTAILPGLHATFNAFNRFSAAPALRLGLGRYLSNPLTGNLMLLRTTGRRSGLRREAPLGYVVVGDAVYCTAGFGPKTFWLQNLRADPHVEVALPGRTFTGIAEEVTDEDERRRIVRRLAESYLLFSWLFTGVNPRTASDEAIMRVFGAFPMVRIRATGIAAGPDDPGGAGWVVSATVATIATFSLVGFMRRVVRTAVRRKEE